MSSSGVGSPNSWPPMPLRCSVGGPATVVVGDERASVPALPTPVLDLVGAGDAFAAGYLAAALGGAGAAGACLAGHRAAASVIVSPGGDVGR